MIKNNGTKTLITDRLILRRFEINDAEDFYKNVGSDYETAKFVVWNKHKDVVQTKKIIENWINEYKTNINTYNWIVELKESKEIIGSISCVKVDLKNEICEIGYAYGSKFWNKGYATEVLKKVIDYLINEEGFYTVFAEHLTSNLVSSKVIKKSGMIYEGTLKNRMIDKNTGKHEDLLVYSISKK